MRNHRWAGPSLMLVAVMAHSAASAITPAAAASTPTRTANTGTTPRLSVFGVPQKSSTLTALKLGGALRDIAQRYPGLPAAHRLRELHAINPAARFRLSVPLTTPEVLIDAVTTGDARALQASLQKLGLSDSSIYSNDVSGWLPVDQLENAATVAELHHARASMPRTRSSIVATQGDFAQRSAAVRATYPALTGDGVTVGVLSDSFDCFAQYTNSSVPASGTNGYAPFGFTATYATDEQPSTGQSTSALPSGVSVVKEASCMDYGAPEQLPFTDEGRAILQIVHAVAPGAGLAFYTAENGEADFANGIESLANAGAKVIDDDVGYPDEPFFQDGLVAQAINTVQAKGVVYFSSAGNDARVSYESTAPSFPVQGNGAQASEKLFNFDPSGATTTTALPITLPGLFPGEFVYLVVEWDQPYVTGSPNSGGATSSIDLCLSGVGSDLVTDNDSYPSPAPCTGGSALGGDPVQFLIIGNPASSTGNTSAVTVTLTIGLASGGAPGRLKLLVSGDGARVSINQFATNSPTLQGHPGAATAAAVGAAFYFDSPGCGTSPATLESFSSAGGDPILFDTSGNRLSTPTIREKPDFVGPDGVNNTMLGGLLTDYGYPSDTLSTTIAACQNSASFPNFFGTSAAAPHAAGAAALMLQANPALTPAQIIAALQDSALPMTPRVAGGAYDYDDGHGFIQIDAALAQLPSSAPLTVNSAAGSTGGSHGGGALGTFTLLGLGGGLMLSRLGRRRQTL
ncbi:MAG TPA: S8 family serine peptidase [Steroidobacteraceae bacterium]|nr:S8 family serine peptidase [Steroidobacteraceae bacterium]